MIIDTHVHIGEMIGFNMPELMVIESMDKYNISFALVSNIEAAEYDHQLNKVPMEAQHSQKEVFIRTIEFAKKFPDRIGAMPWIKPATEHADEEFERLISENRDYVYGMKIHPFHSKTACDDARVEPYLKLAAKYELPVAVHTGGCEEADAIHVYNAALKHPEIDFIMVHMGLGTDNKEAIKLLKKLPNLYGDTTWVSMEHTIQAIKECGSEKILFGSDNPIDGLDTYHNNPKGDISIYQDYFNKLEGEIGKEAYINVMTNNAKRLFFK